ncbi:hypothetical protein NDU88_006629 [Pleurodeles waltl]|uniref:Uncharacterized protein n=1 Tax=Pleurodeles waltl TaxID=8319 RepID=A0AAV7LT62_PLEWA|nr:hypothetical protein NDU88_006629 [Pleurodeles waltl]
MSTGVHQGPFFSTHSATSVFARALSSTSSQTASRFAPGSHRHPGVALLRLSLSAPRRPQSSLGPRPCPEAAPQNVSTVGPPGPIRQLRHSGGTPLASPAVLGPTALEPPQPAAPPGATTSFAGLPPYSPGAARLQERCLAAPRLGATTLGLSGPLRHLSRCGGTRPGSPASPCRLPSRRVGSRLNARPRLRPRAQASGPRARQRADFASRHSPGSQRGPTHARPLPPAQPLRSDLNRPGEGASPNTFSRAPPEREIQACAISGYSTHGTCSLMCTDELPLPGLMYSQQYSRRAALRKLWAECMQAKTFMNKQIIGRHKQAMAY